MGSIPTGGTRAKNYGGHSVVVNTALCGSANGSSNLLGLPSHIILKQSIFKKIDCFCYILYNRYTVDKLIYKLQTMEEFNKLYDFIALAEKNRKYPANTAHGKRAALKLFETALHPDELQSLDLILERMEEIYLTLITQHKDKFSIKSLNTYKGRFINLIQDYKKYGANPEDIIHWEVKPRKHTAQETIEDTNKDIPLSPISSPIHRGVHKLEIVLESGGICSLQAPLAISKKDAQKIKDVLDALAK